MLISSELALKIMWVVKVAEGPGTAALRPWVSEVLASCPRRLLSVHASGQASAGASQQCQALQYGRDLGRPERRWSAGTRLGRKRWMRHRVNVSADGSWRLAKSCLGYHPAWRLAEGRSRKNGSICECGTYNRRVVNRLLQALLVCSL